MAERRERGRASDADACDEQLTEYLGGDGGDIADRVEEAFGTVDPFRRMSNGVRTVTEALALVSTDPSDYPPGTEIVWLKDRGEVRGGRAAAEEVEMPSGRPSEKPNVERSNVEGLSERPSQGAQLCSLAAGIGRTY